MRILAVADEESRSLWDYYSPEKLEGVDLIISCGDLNAPYLEFLATMVTCPVLYVPGNHDSRYIETPPGGCECIDGKIFCYKGVRILGFGGSMKYRNGPFMYTEREMRHRIWRAKASIVKHSGFDILVTHAPVKGFGDMPDLPHRGFECFDTLLNKCRPKYMLHGHVHATYGTFTRERVHPSGTKIVNCFDKYYFDYDEEDPNDTRRIELIKSLTTKFI